MREYRKIYCCGDCIHYDYKRHQCKRGARDEGTGREHFYRDCPEMIYTEEETQYERVN